MYSCSPYVSWKDYHSVLRYQYEASVLVSACHREIYVYHRVLRIQKFCHFSLTMIFHIAFPIMSSCAWFLLPICACEVYPSARDVSHSLLTGICKRGCISLLLFRILFVCIRSCLVTRYSNHLTVVAMSVTYSTASSFSVVSVRCKVLWCYPDTLSFLFIIWFFLWSILQAPGSNFADDFCTTNLKCSVI